MSRRVNRQWSMSETPNTDADFGERTKRFRPARAARNPRNAVYPTGPFTPTSHSQTLIRRTACRILGNSLFRGVDERPPRRLAGRLRSSGIIERPVCSLTGTASSSCDPRLFVGSPAFFWPRVAACRLTHRCVPEAVLTRRRRPKTEPRLTRRLPSWSSRSARPKNNSPTSKRS